MGVPKRPTDQDMAYAKTVWDKLNKDQKSGIRFGLTPIHVLNESKEAGFNPTTIVIALMDIAKQNGGMLV